MTQINIAKDFSDVPLGRYPTDGNFSGERFREERLRPALQKGNVVVNIDGTEGYGSSFLDEAFGGLVRKKYYNAADLHSRLTIEYADPAYKLYSNLIWKYIDEAVPE
jgi:hypothetical protein